MEREGIMDDDNVRFVQTNNDTLGEQLSTIFSPTLKAEMELFVIRTYQNQIEPMMEDLIRRIVRDQINSFLMGIQTRIPATVLQPSDCRTLQLRFLDKLANQILTGSKIMGENGTCIKVALVDEVTGEIVKSGPGASARLRIMMIDDNYMGEDGLNKKINEANKRSDSLLNGNVFISLKEGIGCIDNLSIAHKNQWLKKCKFMLVAIPVDSINGIRVKAAVMEPFTIKDNRNELYKKKEIPALSDDIWRLKNIGRSSTVSKCLEECNIKTVLTFLRESKLNPERLHKQIVDTHMSDKAFRATVSHAEKCIFNREELYEYNRVVFNIVGEIMGGYLPDGHFLSSHEFNDENKVVARNLVLSAFEHGNYSLHTINQTNGSTSKNNEPSIVSHQIISSANPHQDGDIPGPSSGTDFEHGWDFLEDMDQLDVYWQLLDVSSGIAQKRWKLLYLMYTLVVFMRKKKVVSEFLNSNNSQKRQKIC